LIEDVAAEQQVRRRPLTDESGAARIPGFDSLCFWRILVARLEGQGRRRSVSTAAEDALFFRKPPIRQVLYETVVRQPVLKRLEREYQAISPEISCREHIGPHDCRIPRVVRR